LNRAIYARIEDLERQRDLTSAMKTSNHTNYK